MMLVLQDVVVAARLVRVQGVNLGLPFRRGNVSYTIAPNLHLERRYARGDLALGCSVRCTFLSHGMRDTCVHRLKDRGD